MAAVAASVSIPTCKWAQRKDCVFVTVDIPDVTDEVVTVESEKLTFKGKSQGKDYACEMILFAKVNKEESKYKVQARGVSFYLKVRKTKRRETMMKKILAKTVEGQGSQQALRQD